ncbi:hypothetical protein CDCA_CDCA02G0555 [Cyanidium caldarium]|uniref:Zinc finger ZPR1-type domain-containing protein n=1 Tax=Cyanidium caldarium TaxID=2771 RepID=A0AAV9IQF3_CYACA|nr:hypothetical protein CDCA_CDCA02G0555 [Cyanidium caldarium]
MIQSEGPQPPSALFPTVAAVVNEESPVTAVESLCVQCGEQGVTRLLLTDIPHVRQVVLASFECPHCGYRNNEVQDAGEVAEHGVRYRVRVDGGAADLQRSVLLSGWASVSVPEVALEAPASGRGRFTTVEGILLQAVEDLQEYLKERADVEAEARNKLEATVARLDALRQQGSFTLCIDDPSGRSHVEMIAETGKLDKKVRLERYARTREMNVALGLVAPDGSHDAIAASATEESASADLGDGAVVRLPADCPACGHHGENRIHQTVIPHFREVVLIAFTCDDCGFKSSEVKPSGEVSALGRRIVLRVERPDDLSRDLIKSDTARVLVPATELELEPGTLGSKFTTVEGLLRDIIDALREAYLFTQAEQFKEEEERQKRAQFARFLEDMEQLASASRPFELVLDDPAGNSYIQSLSAEGDDPQIEVEEYARTPEQNEMLGIDTETEGARRETS